MRTAIREDIEDLILDAADRLLARYGYRKMTVEDLAREVGIGKGTIYLHFQSKEEVVLSHVDRIVRRLIEQLQTIIESNDEGASEKLKRMLVLRVMYRFESVQHYTESIADLLRDLRQALLARRERYFEEEAQVFREVIMEGQASGEFRAETDALTIAQTLLIATNSLLPFSLSTRELGKRRDIEEKAIRVADLLLWGLAVPVSQPGQIIKKNRKV